MIVSYCLSLWNDPHPATIPHPCSYNCWRYSQHHKFHQRYPPAHHSSFSFFPSSKNSSISWSFKFLLNPKSQHTGNWAELLTLESRISRVDPLTKSLPKTSPFFHSLQLIYGRGKICLFRLKYPSKDFYLIHSNLALCPNHSHHIHIYSLSKHDQLNGAKSRNLVLWA